MCPSVVLTSTFVASEVGATADPGHGECVPDHVLGIPSLLHLAAQTRWIRHHHCPAACAISATVGTWRITALHCSIAGCQCTQAALGIHLRCECEQQHHADAHGYKPLAALHGSRKLMTQPTTRQFTSWATRACNFKSALRIDEDWGCPRTDLYQHYKWPTPAWDHLHSSLTCHGALKPAALPCHLIACRTTSAINTTTMRANKNVFGTWSFPTKSVHKD